MYDKAIGILFSRTRAVEKLLEYITSQEQRNRIMSALSPGAAVLAKDVSGHRVILHCLKQFPREDNEVTIVHGLFSSVLCLITFISFANKQLGKLYGEILFNDKARHLVLRMN